MNNRIDRERIGHHKRDCKQKHNCYKKGSVNHQVKALLYFLSFYLKRVIFSKHKGQIKVSFD